MISPKIKIEAKTQPHPQDATGHPVPDAKKPPEAAPGKARTQPAVTESDQNEQYVPMAAPAVKASTAKGDPQSLFSNLFESFGIKSTPVTYKNGLSSYLITNDQSELDFLDTFNGELLTDGDFKWAATELEVEEAVIRAINEVEAASNGFERLYGRMVPKILYERQWFHRQTNGMYTPDNQDISCPTGYYQKKARLVPITQVITDSTGRSRTVSYWRRYSKERDAARYKESKTGKQLFDEGLATKDKDQYLSSGGSYTRLLKAYRLDKEAALKSCSWGSFQIMGFHHKAIGHSTAAGFVKTMSRSEREQMIALVKFFKNVSPGLISAMKAKNFVKLAQGFNGPGYKDNSYDTKLLNSYNKWKDK